MFLIALGGPTGVGKTTVAYKLREEVPWLEGAVVIEGDQVRRRMLGYDLAYVMQEDQDYTPEMTERVRKQRAELTAEAFSRGQNVIEASGFWELTSRQKIENLALQSGARFCGFWLSAPREILEARINRRLAERADPSVSLEARKGHASDACCGVLAKCNAFPPPAPDEGWHPIDASLSVDEVFKRIAQRI